VFRLPHLQWSFHFYEGKCQQENDAPALLFKMIVTYLNLPERLNLP